MTIRDGAMTERENEGHTMAEANDWKEKGEGINPSQT
jgi:hypothetical protein